MRPDEISAAIRAKFPEVKEEAADNAIIIPGKSLLEVAQYLRGQQFAFDNLHCITAIDRKEDIELAYTLYSIRAHHAITLKTYLPSQDLNITSLTSLWKSADWLEREVYDLFGVIFLNHPDLRRILNPYDWTGYPLRKDYSHPGLITKPKL